MEWGNYTIKGDSLIVQYLVDPASLLDASWSGYELIFLIKDENTLSLLSKRLFDRKKNTPFYKINADKTYIYSDFKFNESNIKPKPGYPKRFRKFYECDEEQDF